MAQNFEVVKNNYIGYFDPLRCPIDHFRPWIQFLNSQCCVSRAICLSADLKVEPLRLLCSSAVISDDLHSISFTIEHTQYTITEGLFCEVFQLPRDNFDRTPSDIELIQFFTRIHYQGPLELTKLSKANLVCEWDILFDTLAKVFSNCTKSNFQHIPSLLQYIAYAIVFNVRLNIGHLIWSLMVRRVSNARIDHDSGRNVRCFYPRFLTILINHVLSDAHKELFSNAVSIPSPTTFSKFYQRLHTSSKWNMTPVVVSPFMAQFIHLPTFEPFVPDQQLVIAAGTSEELPLQVIHPISGSSGTSAQTQVVDRTDQEVVEPQSLSQVREPNTLSNPLTSQPGTASLIRQRSSSEETLSAPTALSPPLKKRKTYRETSVSPSLSSQKDLDIEMAIEQSLETSSEQDESIEIRHRALAICNESSTLPLLTMGEDIQIQETQDTLSGEHLGSETVPTIVTVEVPSQASEGKSDSLPSITESFSPLPEGTSLAPLRDFSLAVFTGESERQPDESVPEEIQYTMSNILTDSFRDRELRTPIAPPLTSLEGARVIFTAGTSTENLDRQLVVRDMNQTPSETQARELSETPLRAIEVSAHTDTNTALLNQLADLQRKLQETQAENNLLKAQVVAQSTTSVSNQLGTVKDDLEGLKNNLLPRLNSIQQSQVLVASDISDLTTSNAQISESVKEIAAISTKVDFILQTTDENQRFNEERMSKLEGGMEHLNEGMKHLYNMIKKSHQPTGDQRTFFEGDDDEDDDADEGGDGRQRGEIRRTSEVNPRASTAQTVEDSSTKGEKEKEGGNREAGGASGKDKEKGKQSLEDTVFDDAYYYQGEQDDFQFDTSGDLRKTISEEAFGEEEVEEASNFEDWEDEADLYTPDPLFQKELKKQQAELRRKEDEQAKVSDIISQKLKIQKAEHEDKQRLHGIHVKERRLDVRMKQGSKWDKAREMFDIPQRGTNNDATFLKLLEKIRTVNPDNSLYMKALKEDILRITSAFDQVRQELFIYVSSALEGSFTISLDLLQRRSLSELWILMSKVKRSSCLNELLYDRLRDSAMKASPQVVHFPYEVKIYRGTTLETVKLDPDSMKLQTAMQLVKLENLLRTSGFASVEKSEVADMISDYCTEKIPRYAQMKNRLKKITNQPVMPSGVVSESDRVLDKDLLVTLQEAEEGEIRD
ncbi:hypothetical protein POM88_007449 [Heracleum sosnowskyi]|uniref:Uncharacterized protein n=1 Tax=Heracleum sosnowskyi TaxID=360622 RepID=A0AAD8J7I2_9APIA|nr:hypothetical protein POM88_007449 [Heracleum sosnowskyi]